LQPLTRARNNAAQIIDGFNSMTIRPQSLVLINNTLVSFPKLALNALIKMQTRFAINLSAVPVRKVRKLLGVITFLAILRIRGVIQADRDHVNIIVAANAGQINQLGNL